MITFHGAGLAQESAWHELVPDLTPLLDILFILLVFFMLSAGVALQSLELKLPTSVAETLSPLEPSRHLVLEIRRQDYLLEGRKIPTFVDLEAAIVAAIAAHPNDEIIIAGDRRIPIERLLKVLSYLQSQGIAAANILMQEEQQ